MQTSCNMVDNMLHTSRQQVPTSRLLWHPNSAETALPRSPPGPIHAPLPGRQPAPQRHFTHATHTKGTLALNPCKKTLALICPADPPRLGGIPLLRGGLSNEGRNTYNPLQCFHYPLPFVLTQQHSRSAPTKLPAAPARSVCSPLVGTSCPCLPLGTAQAPSPWQACWGLHTPSSCPLTAGPWDQRRWRSAGCIKQTTWQTSVFDCVSDR